MKFRYQILLEHHRRVRDLAAGEVSKADAAIAKVQSDLDDLMIRQSQQEQTTARTGAIVVDRLADAARYAAQMDADAAALRQTIERLAAERQRRVDALQQFAVEVKRFEKLRERFISEQSAADAKTANDAMDEAAARTVNVPPWQPANECRSNEGSRYGG